MEKIAQDFYLSEFQGNTFILDAHFDLLMDVQVQREKGRTKVIENDYWQRFVDGGVNVIVASVFVDNDFFPEMVLRKALGQISALYEEVKESPDKLMICYDSDDMETAWQTGKIGFMLSLEGAEPLGEDLSLLRVFYELGVRNLGLVWSRRNQVGDGSHFGPVPEGKKGGITNFGIQVIEEAERLGMTIDVSHLNDEGFWDVIELCKRPIIASHSNARAVCTTMRNLTDEQIKAIASKKGVIGVNGSSLLVADDDHDCHVERLIKHVDYMVQLVGTQHIGIGLDLCDDFMKYISAEDLAKMPRTPFDVVKGHGQLSLFTEGLDKRGYKEEDISRIMGGNFSNVFKRIL